MQMFKMQLNTPPAITQDMQVELVHQVTGEKRSAKPYRDGTVAIANLAAGQWRARVKHPNLLFDVYDRNVRVFKDRPTFVPVRIPTDLFENAPIRDTPEADLGPLQQRLDEAAELSERQADKLGGQPIYADDWNELATTVAGVARSGRELAELVAPDGHDHPELVAKIEEIQGNLQRFFEAFGASIAQLQRQIQQLALQRKVETALERVPDVPAATRQDMEKTVGELAQAWAVQPATYGARKRRTAQKLQGQLAELLVDAEPAVRDDPLVKDLDTYTQAMSSEQAVTTYEAEIGQQQRTNTKSATGSVFDALKAGRIGGL